MNEPVVKVAATGCTSTPVLKTSNQPEPACRARW